VPHLRDGFIVAKVGEAPQPSKNPLQSSQPKVDTLRPEAQGFSPANKTAPKGATALPKAGVKAQPERPDLSPLPLSLLLFVIPRLPTHLKNLSSPSTPKIHLNT
jgi:hypothetical protein